MNLPRLLQLAVNRPLLIAPRNAEIIYSILAQKHGMTPMLTEWNVPVPKSNAFTGSSTSTKEGMPFSLEGGTAIIQVVGELVNRGSYVGASSGVVSYEGTSAQLNSVAADPRVTSILIDIESPGGEAVGAMELAATVRKINAEKPVYAFVNGMAASAGYAMVSGAKRVFTIESGIVGSIGVVMLHMDYSEQMEMMGVKPTLIHAGAHKVDGNPFEPLTAAVKEEWQAEIMKFYGLFVDTVAAGRKMSKKAIRETEARTYIGSEAVSVGLADSVATFEDVLSEITRASGRSKLSKGAIMTENTNVPGATNPGPSAADAAIAATEAANKRMLAVTSHKDICGSAQRLVAATKLLATTMTAEAIVEFVVSSVPASASSSIQERAEANANNLQPGAGGHDKNRATTKSWTDILKAKNLHISQM